MEKSQGQAVELTDYYVILSCSLTSSYQVFAADLQQSLGSGVPWDHPWVFKQGS